MMAWFKQNVSVGNIITMVIIVISTIFSAGVTYNALEARNNEIEAKVGLNSVRNDAQDKRITKTNEQISKTLEIVQNHLINDVSSKLDYSKELDNRYVNKEYYEATRKDLIDRLVRIESLIRTQGNR